MELEKILEKSDKLKQWYWDYGIKRVGKFELGRGRWLDDLHRLTSDAERIKNAENPRSCMALWGPSQTGKSTLLASYIDGPKEVGPEAVDDDPKGINSALTWSDNSPARFVGDTRLADAVLNPYNNEADGSGCVTRFELVEQVKHKDFPVEVRFAERGQIMLSLAVGWISQTDYDKTPLRQESLKEIYKDYETEGKDIKQENFELMVQVVDTLEILIQKYDHTRYRELGDEWEKIRVQLLENEKLLSSKSNIYKFACQVFWNGDDWQSMSNAFIGLMNTLDDIKSKFGTNKVYSSYRVAGILLNIQALYDLTCAENDTNERLQEIKSLVYDSKFKKEEGSVILCEDGGEKLFIDKEYFGYFQALVWELKVPLNRDKLIAIKGHEPALNLLEHTDLLDFPGVANEDSGVGFSDEELQKDVEGKSMVLTAVLKRGKTESIVVASSQEYNIDGFSLLVRMGQYPSKPDQLERGITTWYESFDQGGFDETAKNSDLPINLVLTFSAWLVEQFTRGANKGVGQIWSKMQNLRELRNPDVVETFATNYPQFPPGEISAADDVIKDAISVIIGDNEFKKQFKDHSESFDRIIELNGGKDYFLENLTKQAKNSRRRDLVRRKREQLEDNFAGLLTRALPGEGDEAAQRVRDIEIVINSIDKAINENESPDPGMEVGGRIQNFINVDHKSLDDIPRNAKRRSKVKPVRPFLEKQVTNWINDKIKHYENGLVGMGEIDSDLCHRILHYWGDAIDISALGAWFISELGSVTREKERREFRRFLAIKISNLLLLGKIDLSPHPEPEKISDQLQKIMELEAQSGSLSKDGSPFYLSIVAPFLRRLEELKLSSTEERPPQPGDNELLELCPRD